MGDSLLPEISGPKGIHQESSSRKPSKPDEVTSTITGDALIVFRKKYHFPNDVVMKLPEKSDKACLPPPGFITLYEMSLQAGVRFPLSPELIVILSACEICLSQFSCRAMTIVIGLIAFFRARNATLTPEILARICRFKCDSQGRVSGRSKWLDLRTRDPPKNWANRFFFVKNEWGLLERWGRLKDLPIPLHVGEEDILRILNMSKLEDLQYETRYLGQYVSEEFLFKVGLSIQAGRSHASALKHSNREASSPVLKSSSKETLQIHKGGNKSPTKKRKADESTVRSSSAMSLPPESSIKIQIPEEVLKHSCTGLQRANDLLMKKAELELDLSDSLKDWNAEFVRIKYLQGEYKRRYTAKAKEVADLENQLTECRTELATISTSYSLQCQEVDRARDDAVEARAHASNTKKSLRTLEAKMKALASENTRLSALVTEKEIEVDARAVDDFKNSLEFKTIIQDQVQKNRDHIYDVEVKALELQCYEEGFLRGFLKATRLIHRKTGADIEGLSPSQVSEDPTSDTEDDADSASQSTEEDVDIM